MVQRTIIDVLPCVTFVSAIQVIFIPSANLKWLNGKDQERCRIILLFEQASKQSTPRRISALNHEAEALLPSARNVQHGKSCTLFQFAAVRRAKVMYTAFISLFMRFSQPLKGFGMKQSVSITARPSVDIGADSLSSSCPHCFEK